ncbi:MAG: hypothetical protein ACFFGZ_06950 [Candidatus Thorarchaeota archaeon]
MNKLKWIMPVLLAILVVSTAVLAVSGDGMELNEQIASYNAKIEPVHYSRGNSFPQQDIIYYFDAGNVSDAKSLFESKETNSSVQVTFGGAGWSQETISDWTQNGRVTLQDEAKLHFDGGYFNDSITLNGNATLALEDAFVRKLLQGSSADVPQITLTSTEVELMAWMVQILGDIQISGFNWSGYADGLNTSIDASSSIAEGRVTIRRLSSSASISVEITGADEILTIFQFEQNSAYPSNVTIHDVRMGDNYYIRGINNLTIVDSVVVDIGTGHLELKDCNGTIDNLSYEPNNTIVSLGGYCELNFTDSTFWNFATQGGSGSDGIIRIANCMIDNDLEIGNIMDLELSASTVFGNLTRYFEAYQTDSTFTAHHTFAYVWYGYISNDSSSVYSEPLYHLHVIEGANLTSYASHIAKLTLAANANTTVYGATIEELATTDNDTAIFHDCEIRKTWQEGNGADFSYYDSTIYGPFGYPSMKYFWHSTHYLEDCTVHSAYLGSVNFTAINCVIDNGLSPNGNDWVNITDCQVDSWVFGLEDLIQHFYAKNVSIQEFGGVYLNNPANLFIEFHNVEIGYLTYNSEFTWEIAIGELILENCALGRAAYYDIHYYADKIRIDLSTISWPGAVGSYSATDQLTAERRERVGNETWSDWTEVGTVSGTSITDTTPPTIGNYYDYRVLKHYSNGNSLAATIQYENLIEQFGVGIRLNISDLAPMYVINMPFSVHWNVFNDPDGEENNVYEYELLNPNGTAVGPRSNATENIVHDLIANQAGNWTFRVRASDSNTHFWGEWDELVVPITDPDVPPLSSTTSTEEESEDGEPSASTEGYLFLPTVIAIAGLAIVITRRKMQ